MKAQKNNLTEVAAVCLKLGFIGFGGIAGMVSLIEAEVVTKRSWISRQDYLDTVGAANLIPGPNAVEIIMHCAREKAGKAGLITGGIMFILPAFFICLAWAFLYIKYGQLTSVQPFLFGIRPATTAIIASAVVRLGKGAIRKTHIAVISVAVLAASLMGFNEVALLFGAGIAGSLLMNRKRLFSIIPLPLLFIEYPVTYSRLFLIFLKIGAILYGSGYVLFAYMNDALVQHNHWLSSGQLADAISAGQMTPGPILSSATFAGYLISGVTGAVLATVAIFLPSFVIAFFLDRLLRFINRNKVLRDFLDIVNGASVALIAAVALQMLYTGFTNWRSALILIAAFVLTFFSRVGAGWLLIGGSIAGYLLLLM